MKRSIRRVHRSDSSSLNELNITPLLDLVFVLLVIFIITTPQLTNSLEINLPSGKPLPPRPEVTKPKINRVIVSEKGQTILNGARYTIPQLKKELQRMKTINADMAIVVEGADEADYQNIISVLDILQQLEIVKVGLATAAAGH